MNLFDLWYADLMHGEYVYIRYFENIVGILKNMPPESCSMTGHCIGQFVVEADGSVYPCGFYVFEQYKSGNFVTDSFEEIQTKIKDNILIRQSLEIADECKSCEWEFACRGGCRRDRDNGKDLECNYYCYAYKSFFTYTMDRFIKLAR